MAGRGRSAEGGERRGESTMTLSTEMSGIVLQSTRRSHMWISKVREDLPVSKKFLVGYHAERPVVPMGYHAEFIGKGRTDRCRFLVAETEGILGGAAPYSAEVIRSESIDSRWWCCRWRRGINPAVSSTLPPPP